MSLTSADISALLDNMFESESAHEPLVFYMSPVMHYRLQKIEELRKRHKPFIMAKRKRHRSPAHMPREIRAQAQEAASLRAQRLHPVKKVDFFDYFYGKEHIDG